MIPFPSRQYFRLAEHVLDTAMKRLFKRCCKYAVANEDWSVGRRGSGRVRATTLRPPRTPRVAQAESVRGRHALSFYVLFFCGNALTGDSCWPDFHVRDDHVPCGTKISFSRPKSRLPFAT